MRPEKLRALCRPDEPLEHTLSLISKALAAEPLLDLQLAELLQARSPNKALDQASVLRILEVLDRVSTELAWCARLAICWGMRTR
jgi:predicted membrane chloride channel (bestrophin family)